MQCIYFGDEMCSACVSGQYKPEDDVKKKLCKTEDFSECPRLVAYIAYLNASKGK